MVRCSLQETKTFNMSLNGETKTVKIHEVQVHPTKKYPSSRRSNVRIIRGSHEVNSWFRQSRSKV